MTPLQELFIYYQGLLILQYAGLPKFTQFIQLVCNSAICDGLFLQFPSAFNLTTAQGDQLTLLGEIVGVPREVIGISPYTTYFNFTIYSGSPTSVGFNRYATLVDPDQIDRWQVQNTYTLTDFEMLNLIYLKIIYNNLSNTFSQLKNALWEYFDGAINITSPDVSATYFNFTRYSGSPASIGFNRFSTLTDAYNIERWSAHSIMQLVYTVKQPYYTVMTIAQFLNIVPHSMGVTVIVNEI
jgi:hypothetical protein